MLSSSRLADDSMGSVPFDNLVGKEGKGFQIIMSNFLHERIVLCIQANRMSRICIEDAYEYAVDRKTFGVRLIDQPIIRAKVRLLSSLLPVAVLIPFLRSQTWVASSKPTT